MWGKAIYTAEKASYSCPNYSYKKGQTYQVFLANVLIGDTKEMSPDRSMREPPKKSDGTPYDSVQGNAGDSTVYMVYASRKVLAKYLVTYSL